MTLNAPVIKISQFGTDKYRVRVLCPHCFQTHDFYQRDLKVKKTFQHHCGYKFYYQAVSVPTLSPTLFAVAEAPLVDGMESE